METPVLNKKQQKSSLSAKKSRPKETIKNVMSTPYASFWPIISSSEDYSFLKQVLETNLPKIRVETAKIPWRELKHLKKPERKELRQKTDGRDVDKKNCEGLKLGVNAVTKLLETNTAGAVLIAGDVQPKLMVQHIIDNAVLYKTPIIVFDQLRDVLKACCGVSSSSIGISKHVAGDSKLTLIKEAVETVFEKCPPPVNHINYNRSLDSIILSENPTVTKNSDQKLKQLKFDEEAVQKSMHLERVGTEKVFVPPKIVEKPKKTMEVDLGNSDFIPLSQSDQINIANDIKKKYKHLKVKRIKGNINRNKKKIAHLKKSKKGSLQ